MPATRTARSRPGVSAVDAAKLASISYRQLDYWARLDLIRPTIADAQGSGSQRRYSSDDVRRLALVGQVGALGVPPSACASILEALEGLSWTGYLYVDASGRVALSLDTLGVPVATVIDLAALSSIAVEVDA